MRVPIAHVVEAVSMAAIDLSLFGRPIRNVTCSCASVGATWSSRLLDEDSRRRKTSKQLSTRFALVPPLLSIATELPDDFLSKDENFT